MTNNILTGILEVLSNENEEILKHGDEVEIIINVKRKGE
jgi:hypothetical protein